MHDQTQPTLLAAARSKKGTGLHIKYPELLEAHITYIFYGSLHVINEFEWVWEGQQQNWAHLPTKCSKIGSQDSLLLGNQECSPKKQYTITHL